MIEKLRSTWERTFRRVVQAAAAIVLFGVIIADHGLGVMASSPTGIVYGILMGLIAGVTKWDELIELLRGRRE